jgi:hypothetical protein
MMKPTENTTEHNKEIALRTTTTESFSTELNDRLANKHNKKDNKNKNRTRTVHRRVVFH